MKRSMPKWLICISHFVGHVPHLDHRSERKYHRSMPEGGISFCTEAVKSVATKPHLFLGDLVQNLQYFGLIRTSNGLAIVPIHSLLVC